MSGVKIKGINKDSCKLSYKYAIAKVLVIIPDLVKEAYIYAKDYLENNHNFTLY